MLLLNIGFSSILVRCLSVGGKLFSSVVCSILFSFQCMTITLSTYIVK